MHKIEIDMENVAIPEIHVKDKAKALRDEPDEKDKTDIDYSGAIPEYHPRKQND